MELALKLRTDVKQRPRRSNGEGRQRQLALALLGLATFAFGAVLVVADGAGSLRGFALAGSGEALALLSGGPLLSDVALGRMARILRLTSAALLVAATAISLIALCVAVEAMDLAITQSGSGDGSHSPHHYLTIAMFASAFSFGIAAAGAGMAPPLVLTKPAPTLHAIGAAIRVTRAASVAVTIAAIDGIVQGKPDVAVAFALTLGVAAIGWTLTGKAASSKALESLAAAAADLADGCATLIAEPNLGADQLHKLLKPLLAVEAAASVRTPLPSGMPVTEPEIRAVIRAAVERVIPTQTSARYNPMTAQAEDGLPTDPADLVKSLLIFADDLRTVVLR
jgi:hypothetical protein